VLDGTFHTTIQSLPGCLCPRTRQRGITAIETTLALLVVSIVSIFLLQFLVYTQRIQLRTLQMDLAVQVARDVLNDLKAEQDWRKVAQRTHAIHRYSTDFAVQLLPKDADHEDLVDIELTISWVSPKGLEQLVCTTTLPDKGAGG
jgi:Tfp pilus assembly protein PilV